MNALEETAAIHQLKFRYLRGVDLKLWDLLASTFATDAVSAYASYNEGFKMPTSQQLFVSSLDPFSGGEVIPNPDLRPEQVKSYEAGVRGEFDNGWLSATAFHADYTDFIQRLQEVAPDTRAVQRFRLEAGAECFA